MSDKSLLSLPAYINTHLSEILKAGVLSRKNNLPCDVAIGSFCLRNINSAEPVLDMMAIFNLPYFSAFLFAKVLEDTLSELQILECSNSHLKVVKLETDMPKLLAKKFSIEQPPRADELEGVSRKDLHKDEYKINKLSNDRHFVTDAVFQTFLDLVTYRSFECLAQSIAYFYDRDAYYENLVREEAENRILHRELAKQLRSQRIHIASIHYSLDASIDRLSTEIEDSNLVMEARSRYMSKWQGSREEQHLQTIEDTESPSVNDVLEYNAKIDDEHRVHAEVMRFMEIEIDELMYRVEVEMERYDSSIENIDLQIQVMNNNYQNQRDERMDLEKTFAEHEKDMAEWVTFKQDREDARVYRHKVNEAACSVQAWWRGVLVRQQLGPYKLKRGKRTGPKL